MTRETELAAAIASAVAAHPTRRVPLQVLLAAAASVDHTAASSVGWRTRVLVAISALAEDGTVEVPKTRVDKSAKPPLPAYVQRPAMPPVAREAAIPVVWHTELDWVAMDEDRGLISAAERRFLAKVNAWLPHRRGVIVPLRERSLELFGDEKVLEGWVLGPLFGDGRLTLELLRCEPCWPPVEQRVLGAGDWLLVENYTTYVSISRAAERHGFDGRIVWGSGLQVGTRLSALAATGERPPTCWYFGDIDTGGFRAARLACDRAKELGFDDIAPARGLYRLAVTLGTARLSHGHGRPSDSLARWIHDWFGGPLGDLACSIARSGARVVQENVGIEVLDAAPLSEWFTDVAGDAHR